MSITNKTLSQIFTLALAINTNGVTTLEDISWLRRELFDWANAKLIKIGL
ncbi:hypothetical protein [Halobacteriovorax sp. HLS]|nr:hypothetical protein [Halobacteriovorax sp. HLS]